MKKILILGISSFSGSAFADFMLTKNFSKTTLIIYGPNLNLISIKFLKGKNKNITIDKINNQIRKAANKNHGRVKIIQTNEEGKAINFIQKHRKKIDGIIKTIKPINPIKALVNFTSSSLRYLENT